MAERENYTSAHDSRGKEGFHLDPLATLRALSVCRKCPSAASVKRARLSRVYISQQFGTFPSEPSALVDALRWLVCQRWWSSAQPIIPAGWISLQFWDGWWFCDDSLHGGECVSQRRRKIEQVRSACLAPARNVYTPLTVGNRFTIFPLVSIIEKQKSVFDNKPSFSTSYISAVARN